MTSITVKTILKTLLGNKRPNKVRTRAKTNTCIKRRTIQLSDILLFISFACDIECFAEIEGKIFNGTLLELFC